MRSIVHLDADAFFAAVEQAADPRLRGRPVAVGGEKRGIVASASYEARKFGIYTPMPTSRARRLCPKLIILPGDFEKYERFSRWMFSYAYDFTPDVEITSIDEGYFDLSGTRKSPLEIAGTIRSAIRDALKLTVSEGIGTNKLISQIASKLNKPASFLQVPPGREISFLHPLPNRWLPGIGPHTGARLDAAGLARIHQIAATPADLLSLLVGKTAWQLKQFANAIDERPVVPVSEPAKSYGQQETFATDQTDEPFIDATLRRMADNLMVKVREDASSIRTVTLKVRYNDMAEDQCGESLAEPTDLETDVYPRLQPLLRQAWKRRVSLRLVSLRFSNIYSGFLHTALPLTRSDASHDARRRLTAIIDELRKSHGRQVLLRGHDFTLRQAPPSPAPSKRVTIVVKAPPVPPLPSHGPPPPQAQRAAPIQPPVAQAGSQRPALRQAQSPTPSRVPSPGTAFTPTPNRPRAASRRQLSIPLGIQSYYSFLDSTLSVTAIVELAKKHELPAIALTDQANLHGAVEFFQTARRAGIHPILGAQIRWQGKTAWLYVENATGYHNLCQLLSQPAAYKAQGSEQSSAANASRKRRDKGYPERVQPTPESDESIDSLGLARDIAIPPERTDGLLAASPDPRLAQLFPGRFYLAIRSPEAMEKLAAPSHLPRVAITPACYGAAADRWKYDIVQSIRTRTLLRQAHPAKCLEGDFHFLTPEESRTRFQACPELLERTHEIAERCQFDFTFGQPQFPAFKPTDGSPPRDFLRRLVLEGMQQRYPATQNQMRGQIEEELGIIREVGYEEYFLVVWEILQECRRHGITWITRGSAADSLVCYCLGISGVCPVRFDLYFRRFLNKERMALKKLPDIDIDFPHDRKDDVIDLIFAKYGQKHTAVVGGFSTFQARGAVGDVAKVLGVSEYQIRRFTEHFPWTGAHGLVELLRQSPECRDLPLDEEPYRSALQMAEFLDGFPRYPKMHPCGVVLSREPMQHLTPCFVSQKGYPTTHFDMDAVEAVGLVKMDILAQGGLAVMRDMETMLARRGLEVDFDRCITRPMPAPSPSDTERPSPPANQAIHTLLPSTLADSEPWTDPEVWEMIASGNARAVHHIESPAMVSLCRQCNVREIDGLVAIVSVIRPGAANEQKKLRFTRRYQGLEPVTYPHPSLESCLRSTYGLVVYEEHILQICEAFAGLPPGRADVLRRALGKDKLDVIAEIEVEFFAAARSRGHDEAKIAEVWDLVRGFSGYAFCKAHSTAYGVEAYQSAWLKRYFPAEFMAAVLTNGKGFYQPLVYALECHRLGIKFLPPSVNEPGPAFMVVPPAAQSGTSPKPSIRVPVTYIKGLGERVRERIVTERQRSPFASLPDFYCRVQPSPDEMELLLRASALDGFGQDRPALFWEIQFLIQRWGHASTQGQGWLLPPTPSARQPPPPLTQPTPMQRLQWELELFGFPASGHPLDLYPNIAWDTYCPVTRLGEFIGQQVTLCGLIIEDRVHHQVTGEPMKFLTLADWTGMVETELFAKTYKTYGLATVRYPVLEITATVEPFENGRGHSLRVLRAGRPRQIPQKKVA